MRARYWGEAGDIVADEGDFVVVVFPEDGDKYRFPKGIAGLELPPECHTFGFKSVTTRRCAVCRRPLDNRRRQAKTCSSRCRRALSRSSRK